MNIGFTSASCLVLSMVLLLSPEAMAVKVYQWTDGEGVVHYSDTPPQEEAAPAVNEIVLYDYPGNEADADEYSIVKQLERMTAWRRQAEEDRRSWKQLQLEEERLALEQKNHEPVTEVSYDRYYPVVGYSPYSYYPRAYNFSYRKTFSRFRNRHNHHFFDKNFVLGARGPHQNFTANPNFGRR